VSAPIHVLTLGYSTELLKTRGEGANDSLNRRRFYAEQVDSYTIVTLTRDSDGFCEGHVENIRVIPTNGRNLVHALWRMLRIGYQVCSEGKIGVLQLQEPQVTGLLGYLLSKRFRLPMSICVFGPNPFDVHWRHASLFNRVSAIWGRFVLRRADAIVTDGSLTLERLQHSGLPRERMTWKPMIPSNIAEFATADGGLLRQQLLGGDFDHLLLSVGTMSIQKNVPFMLNALQRVVEKVPRVRFILVGRGRRKPEYQEMARRLGVNDHILWLDAVPHQEIPGYFQAVDVLVMGSRFEGFPRVLMEAAASGLPIVSTEVSGCTDAIVPDRSGFVVEQGDVSGFAQRVVELLENPSRAHEMGGEGQRVMQRLAGERQRFDQLQVEVWKNLALETTLT
jgi:glycosyltransferase involved in cell wall biosynthesis